MKKVVIIGGGFAGLYVAKKLEKRFKVFLIDKKDYFEYTPGVLRIIVEPKHSEKLDIPYRELLPNTKVIIGVATDITKDSVWIGSRRLPFDYLVICSGSKYSSPFKEKDVVIASKGSIIKNNFRRVHNTKNIVLIGGGLFAVELAAEIIEYYKGKNITIIHDRNRLLDRQPGKASRYAEKFLRSKNINIILDENVISKNSKYIKTDKGTQIVAELVLLCACIKLNNEFLIKHFKNVLDERGMVKVNGNLNVINQENIFAAGDIASINEEKTAQNAEQHAKIIVNNIISSENGKPLTEYKPKSRITIISLGKYRGILIYKDFVLTGLIPGLLKSFVEWKNLFNYK